QVVSGCSGAALPTANPNAAPRRLSVTTAVVFQDSLRLLRPRNRAPTWGPVAPSSHSPPWFSGLHSPVRVMSATRSYTASALASTCLMAWSCGVGADDIGLTPSG